MKSLTFIDKHKIKRQMFLSHFLEACGTYDSLYTVCFINRKQVIEGTETQLRQVLWSTDEIRW